MNDGMRPGTLNSSCWGGRGERVITVMRIIEDAGLAGPTEGSPGTVLVVCMDLRKHFGGIAQRLW